MKQFIFLALTLLLIVKVGIAQSKSFRDVPYIETSAKVDTLVTPDRIYLTIVLNEKDLKGKISLEALEKKMTDKLAALGVNVKKQLAATDISSDFKNHFLLPQDILKIKSYSLLVYDAIAAMKVLVGLEAEGIANISLAKTEYSQRENLQLALKSKAVAKAKASAEAMAAPLHQKVGNAIFISDITSNVIPMRAMALRTQRFSKDSNTTAYEPIDIEFQKINIEAAVNIKFKLE
ncbi:hypothetical protein AGMMS4956_18630 [Bacteroidia bacterium]|nr:hypothetical protein AGMMS4956_18630 [Bacteroidia bacterium]